MPDSLAELEGSVELAVEKRLPASFRDPAGYVFRRDGVLYRRVTAQGIPSYRALMASGLYAELTEPSTGLLIPHEEMPSSDASGVEAAVLRPEVVTTISYPYEWCFGQLKDAALATLEIQRRALEHGLWLKDASSYNIQFHRGRPVLIDTLSFEVYREGQPWPAYKQFCQHFLAPLALMSYVDVGLGQLLRVHLDGVPLDLASKLLPTKTRLKLGLMTHIHLHASAQKRYSANNASGDGKTAGLGGDTGHKGPAIAKQGLLGILDSLIGTVKALDYVPEGTTWDKYYSNTNYSDAAMEDKHRIVSGFLDTLTPLPTSAWDLGANNGTFSRLCADRGISTVAWDIDPAAVEQNWRACKTRGEERLLPLLQDLTNPSPGIGWASAERDSFVSRGAGKVGVVLALALIHHLAITHNVPLADIALLFANLCLDDGHLIVEWVPAEDSQAQRLLAQRDGTLETYRHAEFLAAFGAQFTTVADYPVAGTQRRLYLLRVRPRRREQSEEWHMSNGEGFRVHELR